MAAEEICARCTRVKSAVLLYRFDECRIARGAPCLRDELQRAEPPQDRTDETSSAAGPVSPGQGFDASQARSGQAQEQTDLPGTDQAQSREDSEQHRVTGKGQELPTDLAGVGNQDRPAEANGRSPDPPLIVSPLGEHTTMELPQSGIARRLVTRLVGSRIGIVGIGAVLFAALVVFLEPRLQDESTGSPAPAPAQAPALARADPPAPAPATAPAREVSASITAGGIQSKLPPHLDKPTETPQPPRKPTHPTPSPVPPVSPKVDVKPTVRELQTRINADFQRNGLVGLQARIDEHTRAAGSANLVVLVESDGSIPAERGDAVIRTVFAGAELPQPVVQHLERARAAAPPASQATSLTPLEDACKQTYSRLAVLLNWKVPLDCMKPKCCTPKLIQNQECIEYNAQFHLNCD